MLVLFDFDGTIANSLPIALDIVNKLADEFGYKKIEDKNIEELRSKKTRHILRDLNVRFWRIPKISVRMREELAKKTDDIEPIKGINQAIKKVKGAGHRVGIVSTNSKDNVIKFLNKYDINMFDVVYAGIGIFKKRKIFKTLLKDLELEPQNVVYIGDETRDIKAAKRAGIKCIAVTWGLNSGSILESYEPDAIINKPSELVAALDKI